MEEMDRGKRCEGMEEGREVQVEEGEVRMGKEVEEGNKGRNGKGRNDDYRKKITRKRGNGEG